MSWKSTVAYKAMKTDELDDVETWQEDNLFVGFQNTCEVVSNADLWASDEGPMEKMSSLEILYGSQSTVSTQFMKSNYLVIPLTFPAW